MNLLSVTNLECQKGFNLLFKNLSFSLQRGDILRIIGANGCGKTSLLKIVAGLNSYEKGEILYKNKKTNSSNYFEKSYYLGHSHAISKVLTVYENLEFLVSLKQKIKKKKLLSALESVGLKHYKNERCAYLSAGQKRRILIASLFVIDLKLWILDEPFTSLDIDGIEIVENLINNHAKNGGICIFTSHQEPSLFKINKSITL